MKDNQAIRFATLLCACIISMTLVATAQQWNPGFTIGTASGKYEFSYNQAPGQLIEIHPAAIPNTGLTYQWYSSSHPVTGFTAISGATGKNYTISSPLSQTTYFRRKTSKSGLGTIYSNTIKITVVSKNWEDINYIRQHVIKTSGITNWKQVDQLPIGQKLQNTTYMDGLGRTLEKISKGTATPQDGSSTWGDVVSFAKYDDYGRQPKQYLPYTTTTNPGKYKTNTLTEQPQYYTNVYNETSAYSNTTYDNSPLNRIMNVKEPGASWAAASGNSVSYDMNSTEDAVQGFSVNYIRGDAPVHDGVYPANTLYKQTYTDENGKKVVTYTGKSGRLILKKIQSSSSPSGPYNGWICVYSIYDDFGLLRYRLQPKAVSYLAAHSWSFAGTAGAQVLDQLCYQYDYDAKGRVIWKKAPGQQPVQIIYDSRDRIVFTQDGNQAALATPQWTATIYDDLDRPVITTLYNTTETRAQLQADVDNSVSTSTVTVTNAGSPINDLVVGSRDPNITTYKARNSITFVDGFSSEDGAEFVAEIDPDATTPPTTATVAVFKNPIPASRLNDPSATTILKYNFYDDYSYSGAKDFSTDFDNTTAYSTSDPNVLPIAAARRTTGLPTGSKVRVLGTNTFLTSTYYYGEKGHLIQTLKDNIKNGTDITTYQYHFDGRLLSMDTKHTNLHAGYNHFGVLTKYIFDKIGRVAGIQKKLDGQDWKNLSSYAYDDMGRLKTKTLSPSWQGGGAGGGLEQLDYSYNIHDQITGVNKDYALKTSGVYNQNNHFFGFYLGYDNRDNKFNAARLDGHVTGQMWNSKGDNVQRKYDYTYDNPGRISGADFTQNDGGGWSNNTVNFTVSNLDYDLNGNIMSLNRKGLIATTSVPVDNLTYGYQTNSNKLDHVTENGGTTAKLGDFKDGHTGNGDYSYDANGNLTKDLNKGINSITYNYLNLPEQITFTGKGNIKFVYDASGNKLQKIVTDYTASPDRTITTDYVNGFVYKDDTLLFFPTEEGRIRPLSPSGGIEGGFTYDYFVRDHLGDVRMVLTEQTDRSQYLATMEPQNSQTENALFYNINNTREPKPLGYPQDNITTPNTAVAKLNGKDPDRRIGPSIILKVMAGDTIQAAVRAYYKKQATPKTNVGVPAEQMLAGLLQAFVAPGQAAVQTHTSNLQARISSPPVGITSNDLASLKQKNQANQKIDKPKAYLNYVFFDKQLKFVDEGSGVKQVDREPGELETLASGKVVAKKDGYVYVFTSNESNQDVLFDNMSVMQSTGPILEETHYYPFGLVMDGISTVAPLRLENNYKYNGKELNHDEFSDGTGLDWYSYGTREYDPQIARFPQLDPLTDEFAALTPYQYASNDPIANIDLDGLEGFGVLKWLKGAHAFEGGKLGEVTITASRPVTTASNVAKSASVFSKVSGIASGALHGLQVAGNAVVRGFNRFNNAPFWNTGVGRAVDNTSTWINQNVNPVYLLFNGVNSQFTGQDYLTGAPVSHAEGAAQLLSTIPVGKVARVASVGVGAVEREVVNIGERKIAHELPALDATGKVHGVLPKIKDLRKYSKDELKILLKELKQSVKKRIKVTSKLGRDKAHGQRIGAEQDLIKAIERHLQNR